MISKTGGKRVPVDLQRELIDVALLHLHIDGSWEGKDLGGETHQLSEPARLLVVNLLEQILAGKRPYLPKSSAKRGMSADERYVELIKQALWSGAKSMEEAYRLAGGASKTLADGKHDARVREAKRAWQKYWQDRSLAFGAGHRVRVVPPAEMRDWMSQAQATVSKKPSPGK